MNYLQLDASTFYVRLHLPEDCQQIFPQSTFSSTHQQQQLESLDPTLFKVYAHICKTSTLFNPRQQEQPLNATAEASKGSQGQDYGGTNTHQPPTQSKAPSSGVGETPTGPQGQNNAGANALQHTSLLNSPHSALGQDLANNAKGQAHGILVPMSPQGQSQAHQYALRHLMRFSSSNSASGTGSAGLQARRRTDVGAIQPTKLLYTPTQAHINASAGTFGVLVPSSTSFPPSRLACGTPTRLLPGSACSSALQHAVPSVAPRSRYVPTTVAPLKLQPGIPASSDFFTGQKRSAQAIETGDGSDTQANKTSASLLNASVEPHFMRLGTQNARAPKNTKLIALELVAIAKVDRSKKSIECFLVPTWTVGDVCIGDYDKTISLDPMFPQWTPDKDSGLSKFIVNRDLFVSALLELADPARADGFAKDYNINLWSCPKEPIDRVPNNPPVTDKPELGWPIDCVIVFKDLTSLNLRLPSNTQKKFPETVTHLRLLRFVLVGDGDEFGGLKNYLEALMPGKGWNVEIWVLPQVPDSVEMVQWTTWSNLHLIGRDWLSTLSDTYDELSDTHGRKLYVEFRIFSKDKKAVEETATKKEACEGCQTGGRGGRRFFDWCERIGFEPAIVKGMKLRDKRTKP